MTTLRFLPIDLYQKNPSSSGAAEGSLERSFFTWNGKRYLIYANFILPENRPTDTASLRELLSGIAVGFELVDTALNLQQRLHSALKGNANNQTESSFENSPTPIKITAQVDLFQGTLCAILPEEHQKVTEPLQEFLNLFIGCFRAPFAGFHKEWLPKLGAQQLSDKYLFSYSKILSAAPPLLEEIQNKERRMFALDDLYCLNTACPCTDVTCLVRETSPAAHAPPVIVAGFRWNTNTKKLKPIEHLDIKCNPSYWFNRFEQSSFLPLSFLLRYRHETLRSLLR